MDRLPCVILATLSSVGMLGGQDDLLFLGPLWELFDWRLELVKDFFLTSMMLHWEEVLLLMFRCLTFHCFQSYLVVCAAEAVDHHAGDLQILDDLLSLKRRYKERVHFIIGNRPLACWRGRDRHLFEERWK